MLEGSVDLPLPPENLRVQVGPFADADLFERSGGQTVADIVRECSLNAHAQIMEIGCGCGRLARAFAGYLHTDGRYAGFDPSRPMIDWCKLNLESRLPNFSFLHADIRTGDGYFAGAQEVNRFRFPFGREGFDCAVVSSVFTHMLPEEIENYVREISRVLRPGGRCYATVFFFDDAARAAVELGKTIFDFRHPIGPCITFDVARPREGIAFGREWFFDLLERSDLRVERVRTGNWREVRSYEISQDVVVARK
jgi:SAM-dependent methyltransferase